MGTDRGILRYFDAVTTMVRSARLRRRRGGVTLEIRLERVLALRGVPVREEVRAPLRGLTDEERERLDALVPGWLGVAA